MGKPGPASKKRDNEESINLDTSVEEEDDPPSAKKLRIDNPESETAMDKLKERIKKYLEENKEQKFIDIDRMTSSLHEKFPEYRRKKVKVFKVDVEQAFKQLKEALKGGRNGKENRRSQAKLVQVEEVRLEESPVKNSMNSRLSNLYSQGSAAVSPNPADNDDCEVIEVECDVGVNDLSTDATVGDQAYNDEDVVGDDISEVSLTDFEKTQKKAREVALRSQEKDQRSQEKTSKQKTPSRSLSAFIDKGDPATRVRDIESPIFTKLNTSHSTPGIQREGVAPLTSMFSTDSKNNSSTAVTERKTPLETSRTSRDVMLDSPSCRSNGGQKDSVSSETEGTSTGKRGAEDTSGGKKRQKKVLKVAPTTSTITFADFGGNEGVVLSICRLLVHLKHPEVYQRLGVTPPRGFLLHGPPGCGKTLLAHAIAGELQLPFIKVAAPEVVSGVSGDSESKIRELFEQAMASSPCVLFIDEIDSITGKRENAQREMERRMVAQLLTCLDSLGSRPDCQVVVIGATNRPDTIDPALRRAGRFDREIALGIPDKAARKNILKVLCKDLRLEPDTDLAWLAMMTPGYVGADLTSLTREAAMSAVNRVFGDRMGPLGQDLAALLSWLRESKPMDEQQLVELCIKRLDWEEAVKIVQPSAKREGFATVPDVSWSDVGALSEVREELQLAILAPVTHGAQFSSLGLPQSSGVLLVGPPGCGKTLVAKAIANEAGINFISVKGPELMNMYVGESERAVRAVFQRAKNSSPCVIFFDEVDSLCPRRSGASSDGGSRVVNQLLTEMDGVEGRAGVWVMAATNRPDILDPAVLRPGRLDKTLYVGFPGPLDRVEILSALTKCGTRPRLGEGVSLEQVGSDTRCEGFSGADVGNLVREASMSALRENMKKGVEGSETIVVEAEHFERAFRVVRPSVGDKDRARYEAMRVKYQARLALVSNVTPQKGKESKELTDTSDADLTENNLSSPVSVPGINLNNQNNTNVEEVIEEELMSPTPDQKDPGDDVRDNTVCDNNVVIGRILNEHASGNGSSDYFTADDKSPNIQHAADAKCFVSPIVNENEDQSQLSASQNGDSSMVANHNEETSNQDREEAPGTIGDIEEESGVVENMVEDEEMELIKDTEEQDVNMEDSSSVTQDTELNKFYSSLEQPSSPASRVRFLPDMVIRVKDGCKVKEAAGKTGKILSIRQGPGQRVNVKLDGVSSARIVSTQDLEPMIPEEGDKVKSLQVRPGDLEEVGELLSLNEEDAALVSYPMGQPVTVQLETLCKVEI